MTYKLNRYKGKGFKLLGILSAILLILSITFLPKEDSNSEIIDQNDVEDLNLFIGSSVPGQSNVFIYIDFSQSMGDHFAGAQLGNWDQQTPVAECKTEQNVTGTAAIGHCIENAAGINGYLVDKDGNVLDSSFNIAGVSGNAPVFKGCGSISCVNSINGTCYLKDEFDSYVECMHDNYTSIINNSTNSNTLLGNVYVNALLANCGVSAATILSDTGLASLSGPFTAADITALESSLKTRCNTNASRVNAAAAMDNYANYRYANLVGNNNLKKCGALNCVDTTNLSTGNHGCDRTTPAPTELTNLEACINSTNKIQTGSATCSNGQFCSTPKQGSSRMDAAIAAMFDILDSDNSIYDATCSDPNMLFDGVNTVISCGDYINTPFRDLLSTADKTGTDIPLAAPFDADGDGAPDSTAKLIDFLTENDAQTLPIRFRTAAFGGESQSGGGSVSDSCFDNKVYDAPQGGFAGNSAQKFKNAMDFYAKRQAGFRTPLAIGIGFDDNHASSGNVAGNIQNKDVLGIYEGMFKTDKTSGFINCSGDFLIVITDGEDNCSGSCPLDSSGTRVTCGNCTVDSKSGGLGCSDSLPGSTGNSNRRSTLQAVSNTRTHFTRPDVGTISGDFFNKEIMTFVIGWGVQDNPQAVRTLNAAALLGGTHTSGILKHIAPGGSSVGSVVLDGLDGILPDQTTVKSFFPWVIDLAKMSRDGENLASNPYDFTLEDCGNSDLANSENATNFTETCSLGSEPTGVHCHVDNGAESLFSDCFFNTSVAPPTQLFDSTVTGSSFAFFVSNPKQLRDALDQIFEIIGGFTSAGTAPSVPPSISAIGLRDRVLLPNFTLDTSQNMWQGRLALYGFIEDPNNPGTNLIVRKPSTITEYLKNVNQPDEQVDRDKVIDAQIFTDSGSLSSNAMNFFWDAGKLLAERDIIGSARNLYTVDSTIKTTNPDGDGLIYTTDLTTFSTLLAPEVFGIGDADVTFTDTSVFPTVISVNPFCDTTCPSAVMADVCFDLTSNSCEDCVKDCLRDGIVNFMSGHTGLDPLTDNLGQGTTDACTDDIFDNSTTGIIGCGCPDVDEGITGSRDNCERRLGDIFNSIPKFVQSPSLFFPDTGFKFFSDAFRKRDAAIYVGANDGFLHAFYAGKFIDVTNDSTLTDDEKRNPFTGETEFLPFVDAGTGEEIFAYAPPTFLQDARSEIEPTSPALDLTVPESNFPDYRFGDFKTYVTDDNSTQRSFFDGSPTIIDVFLDGDEDQTNGIPDGSCTSTIGTSPDGIIDPCGKEWHTILLSGFRNGGSGITALEVTNFDFDNVDDNNSDGHPDYQNYTSSNAPAYPKHMWTLFDREMGNSWSQPRVGRVRAIFNPNPGPGEETKIVDRWIAFFGGGLDPVFTNPVGDDDTDTTINAEESEFKGSAFYAVDISTGEIIFKFDVNDDPNFICEVPSDPAVVDINGDGYLDLAYVGDTCGRLWRYDISEEITSDENVEDEGGIGDSPQFSTSDWNGKMVFCAADEADCRVNPGMDDSPRKPAAGDVVFPIFYAPSISIDNSGKRHVIFVTGNRRFPSDIDEYGKLYNFVDSYVTSYSSGGNPGPDTFKTEDDVDGTNAGATIALTAAGNAFEFNASGTASGEFLVTFPNGGVTTTNPDGSVNFEGGEKGFGSPIVFSGVLIFTTFNPDAGAADVCTAGLGTGRIYALDYITGAPALFRIPGARSLISSDDVAGVRGGEGIPSPAQISFTEKGTVSLSVAFSGSGVSGGAQFKIWELAKVPSQSQLVYWEEII